MLIRKLALSKAHWHNGGAGQVVLQPKFQDTVQFHSAIQCCPVGFCYAPDVNVTLSTLLLITVTRRLMDLILI